jgi:hypothetical protein
MTHHFALCSIVFMMAFVMVFDRSHHRHRWTVNLLSPEELDQLRMILSACQE